MRCQSHGCEAGPTLYLSLSELDSLLHAVLEAFDQVFMYSLSIYKFTIDNTSVIEPSTHSIVGSMEKTNKLNSLGMPNRVIHMQ